MYPGGQKRRKRFKVSFCGKQPLRGLREGVLGKCDCVRLRFATLANVEKYEKISFAMVANRSVAEFGEKHKFATIAIATVAIATVAFTTAAFATTLAIATVALALKSNRNGMVETLRRTNWFLRVRP